MNIFFPCLFILIGIALIIAGEYSVHQTLHGPDPIREAIVDFGMDGAVAPYAKLLAAEVTLMRFMFWPISLFLIGFAIWMMVDPIPEYN